MVENRGRKTWCVKKKYVKYTQRPMHFLVSVIFQSFLTISVYVIFNIITITKYCVIVNRKTLKIVLYHKSFFLFSFFISLLERLLTGSCLICRLLKSRKNEEIAERYEVVFFSSSKIRGISFLLGEITLQDNSKHLLLVTHSCCVGGVGV